MLVSGTIAASSEAAGQIVELQPEENRGTLFLIANPAYVLHAESSTGVQNGEACWIRRSNVDTSS